MDDNIFMRLARDCLIVVGVICLAVVALMTGMEEGGLIAVGVATGLLGALGTGNTELTKLFKKTPKPIAPPEIKR